MSRATLLAFLLHSLLACGSGPSKDRNDTTSTDVPHVYAGSVDVATNPALIRLITRSETVVYGEIVRCSDESLTVAIVAEIVGRAVQETITVRPFDCRLMGVDRSRSFPVSEVHPTFEAGRRMVMAIAPAPQGLYTLDGEPVELSLGENDVLNAQQIGAYMRVASVQDKVHFLQGLVRADRDLEVGLGVALAGAELASGKVRLMEPLIPDLLNAAEKTSLSPSIRTMAVRALTGFGVFGASWGRDEHPVYGQAVGVLIQFVEDGDKELFLAGETFLNGLGVEGPPLGDRLVVRADYVHSWMTSVDARAERARAWRSWYERGGHLGRRRE